jgi:hypothetical protein
VPGINDFHYADSTMELRFYGCGTDQFELWDSTFIDMHYYTGDSATTITGGQPRIYSSSYLNNPTTFCFATNSETSSIEQAVVVYPNPTSGLTTLKIDLFSASKIEVFNISGYLIKSETINDVDTNPHQIDLSNLSSGLYLIKVSNADTFKTIKVNKQ